jgi:uncharacterized protein (DUF58 family)
MALSLASIPRLSQGDLEIAARRVVEGLYAGRHRSPFTGSAVEFNDHRPYIDGDDLRAIDWKAYARSDHLLIRRYREERDLPLIVMIDNSASMAYGNPAKNEWSRIAAAALGLLAIDQGDRFRLGVGNKLVTPELGGPAALPRLLAALDAITWSGTGTLADSAKQILASLTRRTLIVFIGDFLDEPQELMKPMGALSARGNDVAAIQVLDRSEVALPSEWGWCAVRDPEGAVPLLTCDAVSAKAAYDGAMQAHLQACRKAFMGCQADYELAITDTDVAATLGAWLHRRRRR